MNIRVAKYKAAEEGIRKIKEKYGEESLKYKSVERRKSKLALMEQKQKEEEEKIAPVSFKLLDNVRKGDEIMKEVNEFFDKERNEERQMNLEFFLVNFERSVIPVDYYLEIHRILSLIFHSNKTLSINFSNPTLAGSFQYDCPNNLNLTIDIILYHQITPSEIKEAIEMLIAKFKQILKDESSDFIISISNRINATNLDILVKLKNKPYSFKFIIRDEEFKQFVYYLKTHNSRVNFDVKFPITFVSLRRFFRIWRRQNKLNFIKPEVFDWLIRINLKENMSSSILQIMTKFSKDFKKSFAKNNEIPDIIRNEVENYSEAEQEFIQSSMKNFLNALNEGNIEKIIS